MTELKPCPFCGETTLGASSQVNGHATVGHYIECGHCQNQGPWMFSASAAADAWNARVSPWRSLKDDPPGYPAPIGKSILVRRGMGGYSGTTSYRWRQHKVLDQEPEKALRNGWKEWMEVPE